MELTHSFTVPIGSDQAFDVLTDIERIAPCMPGATIESVDDGEFTGKVKVKVGPMQITYRGTARYTALDRDQRRAVIEARGQEMRGSGTANATITASLLEKGDETEVTVVSTLAVTGRPAQFGRGVMNEVGAKLLGQFADCLSTRLAEDEQPVAPDTAADEGAEISADDAATGVDAAATPDLPDMSTADIDDTTELTPIKAPGSNGEVTDQQITEMAGTATTQPVTLPEQSAPMPEPAEATTAPTPQARGTSAADQPAGTSVADQPIDLFSVAGPSIVKRLAPIAAALLLLLLLLRRRSRSR